MTATTFGTAPDDGYLPMTAAELRADNGQEFRRLLGSICDKAGLNGGQIAMKTTIVRSQAYALGDGKLTSLPNKPEQVRAYVTACRLNPVQVDIVMDIWTVLDSAIKETRNPPKPCVQEPPTDTRDSDLDFVARRVAQLHAESKPLIATRPDDTGVAPKRSSDRATRRRAGPTLIDLCHFVLNDHDRIRGALVLSKMMLVAFAMFLAFAVFLAIQIPMAGILLAIATATVIVVIGVSMACTFWHRG